MKRVVKIHKLESGFYDCTLFKSITGAAEDAGLTRAYLSRVLGKFGCYGDIGRGVVYMYPEEL